jgi:hypothetical protein
MRIAPRDGTQRKMGVCNARLRTQGHRVSSRALKLTARNAYQRTEVNNQPVAGDMRLLARHRV